MKCLLSQPAHCLSLALLDATATRGDIEFLPAASTLDAAAIAVVAPDAILVPPLSDPARCEPAAVYAHADHVEALLEASRALGIPLVWCVSDTLFEEGAEGAIDERVMPRPRDETMRRLVGVGEQLRRHPQHIVLRLGPLFGLEGEDAWLADLIDSLMRGETLRAPQDLVLCPTSVKAVARGLIGMLMQLDSGAGVWGTYHLSGTEPVSAYTFVSVVRTQLATHLEGVGQQVALGALQALNQHHDVPLRRVLDCRRILDVFGIHQKSWRLELGLMLDAWCERYDTGGTDDSPDAGDDDNPGSNEEAADT
ncbi:sugar nucleotide-binding protein [Salinicola rhizosphaerae]|uniref:sugar nucleotide-binding protein n=1 Tax=Salinicola rhizosphaerae TaxID=1443141 RepID=UPI00167A9D5E|nr:sugar nucleotide-binding protein [Salinicola rhizosphaerae]